MRGMTRMALGVSIVLFAVVAARVAAAGAEDDVKLVFHVEGMR